MLAHERQQASFPLEEMSRIIYGSEERFNQFVQKQKYFDNHPVFKANFDYYNWSRQDQILNTAQKTAEYSSQATFDDDKSFDAVVLCNQGIFVSTVHIAMVVPAFRVLASDEQVSKWMAKLQNLEVLSCYAQTELAHGSDVQNLQTTATFQNGGFIIHTPSVEATKFWPGELGLYCNHALVFCRLIVQGKEYGVHPLFVQIRDLKTHKPLPGVQVGDIGTKLGYATKDNGYLSFDHYHAPIDALLNRYIKVHLDGRVERLGNPKVGYGSMMIMRNILCDQYTRYAGVALTIAVRYSLYRRQFKDDNKEEIRILDYQLQQNKLFPLIAEYYACIFGALRIKELVIQNFEAIAKHNDFSLLGLTHALLCGAKATCTYYVSNCAEQCRLSCGGHGFAHYSGLPIICFELAPNITLEGENTILNLQLARYLLKMLNYSQSKPDSVPGFFKFLLADPSEVNSVQLGTLEELRDAVALNCNILVRQAARKLLEDSKDMREQWDKKAGVALVRAASAFMPYFNLCCYIETINQKANKTKAVLTDLGKLYAITQLLSSMHGLLLGNLIKQSQFDELQSTRDALLVSLRPNALALVECQGFSDNTLKSLIAPYDGDVYQNLYNFAKNENSLNKVAVAEGHQHIKKMSEINAKL